MIKTRKRKEIRKMQRDGSLEKLTSQRRHKLATKRHIRPKNAYRNHFILQRPTQRPLAQLIRKYTAVCVCPLHTHKFETHHNHWSFIAI